jgi:S1-C subfamily serine protease
MCSLERRPPLQAIANRPGSPPEAPEAAEELMKRMVMAMGLLLAAAAAQPTLTEKAAAQTLTTRSFAAATSAEPSPGRKGGLLGFVYSGSLANGDDALRWADYPVVRHVFSGSPAEGAGLRVGDAILQVNGRDGTETTAYHGSRVGQSWTLVVQRGLEQREIRFVLVEPTWLASEWTPPPGSYRAP